MTSITVIKLTEEQYNSKCRACPYAEKLGMHNVCYKEDFMRCKEELKKEKENSQKKAS